MQHITYAEFLGRYKIRQKIGEGGYGQVFRVYDCETKQYMAYKKIVLRRNEDPYSFLTEIEIQRFLAHPLVLKIFEFYLYQAHDKHLGSKVEIGIISELGKTSLQRLIRDKTNDFPIEQIINFSFHFIKLFAYFQDLKIVHRDIKPQNFVQVGPGLTCKLIDFGLCTHVKDIRHTAGSFGYMSPKLKKMHTHKELRGAIKTNPYKDDVYSFGLTLYELITRQGPGTRIKESTHKFSSNVFYKTQNQKLAQIVQLMLEYEEESRPDFNQLYVIFKNQFNFIEEDPVNEFDGYSDKDLAKMNCHQRHAVIKKRHECQQNKEKTQKKKIQDFDFKKTNKFHETEQRDEYNYEGFERKQVHYVDKEMQEEVNRRKKRHFGNEKVILKEESTSNTGKYDKYYKEDSSKYEKTQERYNKPNQEQEREQESPQEYIENDKTVEIDRNVAYDQQIQNEVEPNFSNSNQISQQTVEIPVNVQQPTQAQQIQEEQQPKYEKFFVRLPEGISVTAIMMIKEFIICGCQDGSLRVINTISKNKRISYKITDAKYSHEGSKITVMTKDTMGKIWTASEDGKLIMWDRVRLFTQLTNENSFIEENVEEIDQNGQKQVKKLGFVKMQPQNNVLIDLSKYFRPGITALYCYNDKNYAIGYNNGVVVVRWGDKNFTHEYHQNSITSIKYQDEEIYTASLDGTISILDMKQNRIRDGVFRCNYGIRNFFVSGDVEMPAFFVATVDGKGFKLQTQLGFWEVSEDENDKAIPPIQVKDAFFVGDELAFTLTPNGHILRNGQPALSCEGGEAWSCMSWDNNQSIAVGSSKGYVCMIRCG